jgi:hypothetical protein
MTKPRPARPIPEYVYGMDCTARVGTQIDVGGGISGPPLPPTVTLYVDQGEFFPAHVHVYFTAEQAKQLRRQLTQAINQVEKASTS